MKQQALSLDRLGLAIFTAAVFHAVLILGVGFHAADKVTDSGAINIILVAEHNKEKSPQAEHLSTVDHDGGDIAEDSKQARGKLKPPQPTPTKPAAPKRPQTASTTPPQRLLTRYLGMHSRQGSLATTQTRQQEDKPHQKQTRAASSLAQNSTGFDDLLRSYNRRPRKHFVHARSRASPAASYMYDWVAKTERIGNINYPPEARQKDLSGTLVLVVGIRPDGHISDIRQIKSSGHSLLDEAAKHIVHLAAPYPAFSAELREETDILYITRTWFFANGRIKSR